MPFIRYDRTSFAKAIKTDEGFLMDSPVVARTGILIYRNADGSERRELRLPEDVFHADSLASFAGKPITVDHPSTPLSHKNARLHTVGTMLAAGRADGENVKADIVIHDSEAIGDRRQLSLGYSVDLDETPGEYKGERYDAKQTNIRVNHLSVVKSARAGAVARLNLDSNEEIDNHVELVQMPKIRLDNDLEYEAPAEVIAEIVKIRKDAASAVSALTEKEKAVQTLTGQVDTLKARVDSIPAEIAKAVTDAEAKARTDAAEAAKLADVAKQFKIDAKDKTPEQIKHAVILSFNKDAKLKGKSEDYINAAFDMVVGTRADAAIANQRKESTGNPTRTDNVSVDHRSAYRATLGSNAATA